MDRAVTELADEIVALQRCVSNHLDPAAVGRKKLVGIIGDAPSSYSKSPALWNAVFQTLRMEIAYIPMDVDESQLSKLLRAMRSSPRFLGANVTVPYKIKIIRDLDRLEEKTTRINAVNTIMRSPEGELLGHNTDGQGFLVSLLSVLPGQKSPFLPQINGTDVLLIGAGGAARAVAFSLAEVLGTGTLVICNRTKESAQALARDLQEVFPHVIAIGEDDIGAWAPRVGLIVNSSVKGQGGLRKTANHKITLLEPYSALAPANAAVFPETESSAPEFSQRWLKASLTDIGNNNRISLELALRVPTHVAFYDLIYAPAETVFLRHARLSGHRTLNGKGMIIAQATESLFHRIARPMLENTGNYNPAMYQQILTLMFAAW